MNTLRLSIVPLALTGGLSSMALAAGDGLSQSELDALLNQADRHGFSHYQEVAVDDESHLELEGWRDDGWQLDVDMLIEDGTLVHEEQRKSQIPDWSLTADEVREALANARQAGLQQFQGLDVDEQGDFDIEGYDAQQREIELRMNSNDLSVIGVEND